MPFAAALRVLWALGGGCVAAALALALRHSRHHLERERQASARAEAETIAAIQMRDHLMASASHDLKSPLASMRLLIHVLKREAEKGSIAPDRLAERLDLIEANVERMSSLIAELLDVAKLQGGEELELHLAGTDLLALARGVAQRLEPNGQSRLHVETSLSNLTGCWDAARLERLLTNLAANGL